MIIIKLLMKQIYFLIQIQLISSMITQFEESNKINYLYSYTDQNFIYLSSYYLLEINNGIKTNLFNFPLTSKSHIVIMDTNEKIFVISCTDNNLIEIINISTSETLYYFEYNNINPIFDCPLYYSKDTNYFYVNIVYQVDDDIFTMCLYGIYNSANNLVSFISKSFFINYSDFISEESISECYESNYHDSNVIFKNTSQGILHNRQIIYSKSVDFKITLSHDNDELIVYFYDNTLKIYSYKNSNGVIYDLETKSSFNFNELSMVKFIDSDNIEYLLLVYKNKDNGNLILETLKYDGSYGRYEYYEIKNNIGYSTNFIKNIPDSSDYLILTKGDSNNLNKYEYFSYDFIKSIFTPKFLEPSEVYEFLTTSKVNIEILFSKLFLNNMLLTDSIIFSPDNIEYRIIDNTKVEIIITEDSGIIQLGYKGLKTNYSNSNGNYEITYEKTDEIYAVTIYICNIACSHCTEILSKNSSPTKCTNKRCSDGYYYLLTDETECEIISNTCYESCNTCSENGSENNHKCESCKYGYDLYENSFCIKCDKSIKYYYYDLNLNKKECIYNNNECPDNYPYLNDITGECVKNCPNDLILEIEDKKCVEPLFYIDNLNNKILMNSYNCEGNYPYLIYLTRQCIDDYLSKNKKLIDGSNICIDDCSILNLTEINNICVCDDDDKLIIKSKEKIYCNSHLIETLIEEISKLMNLNDAIDLIENNLYILKNYDDLIIEFKEHKLQVLNNDLINNYNSKSPLAGINLLECENILKEHYNINPNEPLFIMLINSPSKTNSLINTINYNIYSQEGKQLDLSLCKNEEIIIYNSLGENSDKINIDLIKQLEEDKIELYNYNSDFYHDKCFGYNLNNNDINTKDRREDIYSSVSVCESNCNFGEYNEEKKIVKCFCQIKENFNETIPKEEATNFFKSMNDQINYNLFTCHKAFKKFGKNFYKNEGFWIFSTIFIIEIICVIIYLLYTKNKIFEEVNSNYKKSEDNKSNKNNQKNTFIINHNPPKKRTINIKELNPNEVPKIIIVKDEIGEININSSKNVNFHQDIINKDPSQINSHSKMSSRSYLTLIDSKSDKNIDSLRTEKNLVSQVNNTNYINKFKKPILIGKNPNDENNFQDKLVLKYTKLFNKKENNNYWEMTYLNAIEYDKRTFFKSYISFLFSKYEIISILFFPEDYEYFSITFSFYLFGLLFDFSINTLLFADDIVHQKYSNEGKLHFFTETLLSLISNLITSIVMKFMRKLILYSFVFDLLNYEIKEENHYLFLLNQNIKIIHKRIIVCFILELLISLVCGYYIYIFCEIYKKSQISLLINFILGLAYSIVIVLSIGLIVCILRIISLKYKKKKVYNSSRYIGQLI